MGLLLKLYLSNIVKRFDKDGIIPYLSNEDFEGLQKEDNNFINSDNNKIAYFYYFYEGYKKDKLVLFLHGIGPGHTAYISEIETLCKRGYRVLTLDYTGCDASEGDSLNSINQPTKDVDELLKYLDVKEEIVLVGHSLGGYTALNTININSNIKKAVVISGFISLKNELKALMKLSLLVNSALKYEKTKCIEFNNIDNLNYLSTTDDKILFIHSLDDTMVPYRTSTGFIKENIDNPNLSFVIDNNKKHNPNYSLEAVKYMNDVFATYNRKIKCKELNTFEKKKEFMSDKSAKMMTVQDAEIWNKIFEFLDK